jgi:TonB-linked SusC/RagA family outer membrane protein
MFIRDSQAVTLFIKPSGSMRSSRLTVFLLVACLLECRLSYSQTDPLITLRKKDVPLQEVLDEIQSKTGYAYFGEGDWPELAHKVNVSVRNASIRQVLDLCFLDQPVIYELDDKAHFIFIRLRKKEERCIRGRIVDEDSDPIIGATIVAQGDASAVSNDAGYFEITTRFSDSKLVITRVGFEQQVVPLTPLVKEPTITLRSQTTEMAEAVVLHTGYQDVKRKSSAGSFDEVDNELLNRRVSTNILDRIDGVTSGVLFNRNTGGTVNASQVTIRGRSTIYANPNPLVVVDNFPYPGNINTINPADVESITVLKDAAAAAIWGAASGNGVIVITTKKGKASRQPALGFTSGITVGARPDLYYKKVLSSGDYIDIEEYLWGQGFYQPYLMNPQFPALSPVVEILDSSLNGYYDKNTAKEKIDELRRVDTRTDLGKYFYRSSWNSQYALNVTGGDTQDQYYLSAGYDRNLSNLVRNEYDRVTLMANNSFDVIRKKVELQTGLAWTTTRSYLNNTGGTGINYPYLQLADAHGNSLPVNFGLRMPYVDTVGQSGGGGLLDWHFSPLGELQQADNRVRLTDYRINIGLRYRIRKGLSLQGFYQFGSGDSVLVNYYSQKTYYARNLINSFAQDVGGVLRFPVPRGGILNEVNDYYAVNNVRVQISFTDTLFRHGLLNAVGGAEVRDVEGNQRTSWQYGYNPDLATATPVDYLNTYPEYTTGVPIQLPYRDGTVATTEHYLSYYAVAGYSWRNRYLISASARRDESNLFGVRTNQKGVPLWSAGLAWDISSERFYRLRTIPFLKLRITDGLTGNIDRNLSAYTTANINGGVNGYGSPTATIINPPNPNLRWERINIFNLGLDFALPGAKFGGTVEYYIKTGVDLIGPNLIDPTAGVSIFEENSAGMRDHGVDLTLHSDHTIGHIRWSSALLFSYVQDNVTNYKVRLGSVGDYLDDSKINPLVGHPLYSVYALGWKGLDPKSGAPTGVLKGNGSLDYGSIFSSDNLGDLIYKGPVNPSVFGSWRNGLAWKQWALSVNIVYKMGHVLRRSSIFYSQVYFGASPGNPDYERRWQHPGDEKFTNVPSISYPPDLLRDAFYQNSEVLIIKGDHIRLQDVQLAYDWKKQNHPGLPFELMRLYLYANNLGILWKANHFGIDPDFPGGMPSPRTLAFGVKIEY